MNLNIFKKKTSPKGKLFFFRFNSHNAFIYHYCRCSSTLMLFPNHHIFCWASLFSICLFKVLAFKCESMSVQLFSFFFLDFAIFFANVLYLKFVWSIGLMNLIIDILVHFTDALRTSKREMAVATRGNIFLLIFTVIAYHYWISTFTNAVGVCLEEIMVTVCASFFQE